MKITHKSWGETTHIFDYKKADVVEEERKREDFDEKWDNFGTGIPKMVQTNVKTYVDTVMFITCPMCFEKIEIGTKKSKEI